MILEDKRRYFEGNRLMSLINDLSRLRKAVNGILIVRNVQRGSVCKILSMTKCSLSNW